MEEAIFSWVRLLDASIALAMALVFLKYQHVQSEKRIAAKDQEISELKAEKREDKAYERERSLAQQGTLLKVNDTMGGLTTSIVAIAEVLK